MIIAGLGHVNVRLALQWSCDCMPASIAIKDKLVHPPGALGLVTLELYFDIVNEQ